MWNNQSIAVVLPTYNEHLSIAECINRFDALGIVDHIIVVNNNAHPDTSPAVAGTSAIEVFESEQGYGAAIQRGLKEAMALNVDLISICEPDGTFDPEDLLKLLPYTGDVEVVFGSRTIQEFILSGANMGTFLKWGNWAVAKIVEVLFNTIYLSDVGCTFRVMSRTSVEQIGPYFQRKGSAFGFEMMLHVVSHRISFVQLPLNYNPRVGKSSVTGSRWKTLILGMEMFGMCFTARARRSRK